MCGTAAEGGAAAHGGAAAVGGAQPAVRGLGPAVGVPAEGLCLLWLTDWLAGHGKDAQAVGQLLSLAEQGMLQQTVGIELVGTWQTRCVCDAGCMTLAVTVCRAAQQQTAPAAAVIAAAEHCQFSVAQRAQSLEWAQTQNCKAAGECPGHCHCWPQAGALPVQSRWRWAAASVHVWVAAVWQGRAQQARCCKAQARRVPTAAPGKSQGGVAVAPAGAAAVAAAALAAAMSNAAAATAAEVRQHQPEAWAAAGMPAPVTAAAAVD